MLRAAILHECQNYLGDGAGAGLGGSEKNIFLAPPGGGGGGGGPVWVEFIKIFFSPLLPPPPPRAIIPDAGPLGTFENQDTRDGKTRYI